MNPSFYDRDFDISIQIATKSLLENAIKSL